RGRRGPAPRRGARRTGERGEGIGASRGEAWGCEGSAGVVVDGLPARAVPDPDRREPPARLVFAPAREHEAARDEGMRGAERRDRDLLEAALLDGLAVAPEVLRQQCPRVVP